MSNEVKITSVCTCCCVKVHTNVTAGNIFLSQISYSDSPKDSLFITLLYSTFSLWFYSFFSFGICTVKSTQPERWSGGLKDPLLFFCGDKIHCYCLSTSQLFYRHNLFYDKKRTLMKIPTKCFYKFYLYSILTIRRQWTKIFW